jgi:glycosyltransferase involved in cell wall biosynthesis
MRIAYVCADLGVPVFGSKGCSVHVQEVLRAFRALGANVSLFPARVGGVPPEALRDVPVCPLPDVPKGDAADRERHAMAAQETLLERLRAAGPFDLVYERYSLWGWAGMRYAQQTFTPGILEVNATLIEEQRQHRSLVHANEAQSIARRAFTSASAVVTVSRQVADYVRQQGAPGSRVHVVPNGVDPERFPDGLEPSSPTRDGVFTVGFVGSM